MKLFIVFLSLFLEAVFIEALPKNKLKPFITSEKAVPVVEQTYSRHHDLPNGFEDRTYSPNWNSIHPNDISNPNLNPDNWVLPEDTFLRNNVFPNDVAVRSFSSNLNDQQPKDERNPKRNQMNWNFPEQNTHEVLIEQPFNKSQISPNFKTFNNTQTGNGNKGGKHRAFGQVPWKSLKPDVETLNMNHNTMDDRQQQLEMDNNFMPDSSNRKTASSTWSKRQPQDVYNFKRNNMVRIFPEYKYQSVFGEQPPTKTQFMPNLESNDMIHPGYLKDGHGSYVEQTKWTPPISSVYVDYPGKRANMRKVKQQQHQANLNYPEPMSSKYYETQDTVGQIPLDSNYDPYETQQQIQEEWNAPVRVPKLYISHTPPNLFNSVYRPQAPVKTTYYTK